MSEYITTYTGIHFKPTEPEPELIRVEDIAHALSMICRGNGHVHTFWVGGRTLHLLCEGSGSQRFAGPHGACVPAS